MSYRNKVIDRTVLANEIVRIRGAVGSRLERRPVVVQCSGCFDLLHPGHVLHLQTARTYGDLLIVTLNADARVRALKGVGRPVLGLKDRLLLVASQEAVDYVTWFEEETPDQIIDIIRPDVYVKGAEYAFDQIPELATVFRHGAFRPVPQTEWSTTKLIHRMVEPYIDSLARFGIDDGPKQHDEDPVRVTDREGSTGT
mgnify:CR=1 FL=1